MKTFTTKSNKKIYVWDNLVNYSQAYTFFSYASNSFYRIGWDDGSSEERRKHKYMHCLLTFEESESAGILPIVLNSDISKNFNGESYKKSVINLSHPSDVYFPHTHEEKYVVLYYANLSWYTHWYGETLFYNEDLSEIELSLPYTPQRLIMFEGSIPHSIRPQSFLADSHRFTYAMFFN